MPEETTRCPQPQVESPPRPPAPLQPAAQDSIRLRTGNPLYGFAGAGGPGNLLRMERKDTPAPRDHLSISSEAGGGSLGVPLLGCSGEAGGDRLSPPGCGDGGCCWLREFVGGRRLIGVVVGVQILLGKG